VDIVTATDTTWQDAFQFDPTGPTGTSFVPFTGTGPAWTLTGYNFRFNIKSNWLQPTPLITVDSGVPGQQVIVIQDANSRIISTNVPDVALFASAYPNGITGWTGVTGPGLIPGRYCYDLVMYDGSSPQPVKIGLMHGIFELQVGQGNP
jgi:hypothetical protein